MLGPKLHESPQSVSSIPFPKPSRNLKPKLRQNLKANPR